MFRPGLPLFLAATLFASTTSWAAAGKPKKATDTTAPTITHAPPGQCPATPSCDVEAVIVDDSGVFDPTLLFRLKGGAAYDRAPMKKKEGADASANVYVGVVPAAVAAAGDVEYLIEAFDVEGNGPARAGTEGGPLLLKKVIAPVVVVTPPPQPPAVVVEEDNTGLIVGVVAVSAVVVVAAAVGIGVAVYALRPPAVDVVTVKVDAGDPFALMVRP